MAGEYEEKVNNRLAVLGQAAALRRGAQEPSLSDKKKIEKFKSEYVAAVSASVPEKSGEEKKSNA